MGGTRDAPSDRMRDRVDRSNVELWVLLTADRTVVTLLLLAVVVVTLVGVGYLLPGADSAIRTTDSVDTLFQGLLTASVTVVTLVLTLNQLVLSQELGAVGDQQERMEEAMEFRSEVAAVLGTAVSPVQPAEFLRAMVEVTESRAERLRESVPGGASEDLRADVDRLTDSVVGNARKVSSDLEDARFGEFDVIAAVLDFNYSWKLHVSRQLRDRYRDELPPSGDEALSELVEVLELFGPAREHFKTLYFQWALIDLSRRIIGAAIPAVLVAGSMLLYFDSATYQGLVFGIETLPIVIGATAAVSLLPFLLLLSAVLRIATVTKRTLSIGPFILRDTDAVPDDEWDP